MFPAGSGATAECVGRDAGLLRRVRLFGRAGSAAGYSVLPMRRSVAEKGAHVAAE